MEYKDSTRQPDMEEVIEEPDEYCDYVQSIRTETGLEVGLSINWPEIESFELTTTLPEQAIAPMFHGTQWAGTRLWRAAVVALQYLLSDADASRSIEWKQSTRVIELGCGLGVPGMILAMAKRCHVVLTDQEDLLTQLETNVKSLLDKNPSLRLEACALDWSAKEVEKLTRFYGNFDVVLNCDCIFEPLYEDSWKHLAECQEAFLQRNPQTFMVTVVERRRFDGIEKYLERMESSPMVASVQLIATSFESPTEIELYRFHGVVSNI